MANFEDKASAEAVWATEAVLAAEVALAEDDRPASTVVRQDGRLPAAPSRTNPSLHGLLPATGREASILRIVIPLAIILITATIVCFGLSFVLARQADDRAEAGHRQALRGAVEALQAVAPDLSVDDPRIIRILEEASGLKGLRFGDDPPDGDRETQTLLDPKGRIVEIGRAHV